MLNYFSFTVCKACINGEEKERRGEVRVKAGGRGRERDPHTHSTDGKVKREEKYNMKGKEERYTIREKL